MLLTKPTPATTQKLVSLWTSSFRRLSTLDLPRRVGARYVDLRSDTVTKPTAEMTIAMMDAAVGDDVLCEDPTVNALERKAADLFEKEAALFVPSGTMGNIVSIAAHCNRGEEVVLGEESHIYRYEAGSASALLGVPMFTIANAEDGTLPLDQLRASIKPDDPHFTSTRLVALENSQNRCGGRALSPEYVQEVVDFCEDHGLSLHMDGARLLNATVALGISPADGLRGVHSASLCLSKGLGAPVGSVVVGSGDFIYRARRIRKSLGGGMRQAGVIAAAGIVALESGIQHLATDNRHAKAFARVVESIPGASVPGGAASIQTNIVYFDVDESYGNTPALAIIERLKSEYQVLLGEYGTHKLRAVFHHQVTADEAATAGEVLREVLTSLRSA